MQFESIVTNSSLSFRDVVFLQLAPQFQPLFDLAGNGKVDWRSFFNDLGSIPDNFNKENLATDIGNLYDMGVSIAGGGVENMMEALLGGSSFNDIAKGNVIAIVNAAESSYGFYKALEQDLGGTLLSMVGGPENVARLFCIDSYNMTSWMTDYLRETMGQYYTQRWYIYRRDSGSEILCNYIPPTDNNSILNSGAWTRFNTTDVNFYPSSAQTEQILSNSESYAGWSRNKVKQMNASGDGFHYSISYSRYAYILQRRTSSTLRLTPIPSVSLKTGTGRKRYTRMFSTPIQWIWVPSSDRCRHDWRSSTTMRKAMSITSVRIPKIIIRLPTKAR